MKLELEKLLNERLKNDATKKEQWSTECKDIVMNFTQMFVGGFDKLDVSMYTDWQKDILLNKFEEFGLPVFLVNKSYIEFDLPKGIELLNYNK